MTLPATATPLAMSGGLLTWGLAFFGLAIVAAFVGFRGVAGVSMRIGKLLVLVFLVLAVLTFLL